MKGRSTHVLGLYHASHHLCGSYSSPGQGDPTRRVHGPAGLAQVNAGQWDRPAGLFFSLGQMTSIRKAQEKEGCQMGLAGSSSHGPLSHQDVVTFSRRRRDPGFYILKLWVPDTNLLKAFVGDGMATETWVCKKQQFL